MPSLLLDTGSTMSCGDGCAAIPAGVEALEGPPALLMDDLFSNSWPVSDALELPPSLLVRCPESSNVDAEARY